MVIEWREEWLLGEERIDAEHLEAVSLINALHGAVGRGESREVLATLLRALLARSREHFAYEEGLMAAGGYAHAADHAEQHQRLLGILTMALETVDMADGEMVLGTVGVFDDWFITHVETSDAALGRFLGEQAGGEQAG